MVSFCPKAKRHHFIIDLILILSLIITIIGIIFQLWFMQFDIEKDGLTTKRYLIKPLLNILSENNKDNIEDGNWVEMVIMEGGELIYPHSGFNSFFENIFTATDEDYLTQFMSLMVETIPEDMSIVKFYYNGNKGLCFFFDDKLPHVMKVLKTPKTLLRILIIMIFFISLGALLNYRLKKNINELGLAIDRMKDLDFDTPINVLHKNELGDILTAFDDMRKELKLNRSKGILLITSITHDLKTPLTSLRGFLEAINDGMIDTKDDVMIAVDKMLNKTNLLESRINEMLEFSRTMNFINSNNDESFSVKKWLHELKQYLIEESDLNSINFSIKDDYTGDDYILGNPKQLTRAVINLYDNACRYIKNGDPIRFTISVNHKIENLILTMEDGGKGVLTEDREKIFDLFFRKDRGRNTRGMGIGLASVKFISEIFAGSVICEESELGGASFKVKLPLKMIV